MNRNSDICERKDSYIYKQNDITKSGQSQVSPAYSLTPQLGRAYHKSAAITFKGKYVDGGSGERRLDKRGISRALRNRPIGVLPLL